MTKTNTEWKTTDSFWQTFQPTIFGKKVIASAPAEVAGIIKMLNISPGSAVLDLCCGIGRHALHLAKLPCKVTGVDITESYITQAMQKAAEMNLDIEFITDDARSFVREKAFDFALNIFDSFGCSNDIQDDRRVLENIYASLKPGGKLILDTLGKESMAFFFQEKDFHEENNYILLCRRKALDNFSKLQNHWTLLKDGQRTEKHFTQRLYSAYQLSELLKQIGFINISSFCNFQGSPYTPYAKKLIVTAEKK